MIVRTTGIIRHKYNRHKKGTWIIVQILKNEFKKTKYKVWGLVGTAVFVSVTGFW